MSPIGRGKTTFINYAARIQFPKELNITNIKFIIVDVKNWFVTDPNKFHPQLLKSLDSWIKETYPEFVPNEAALDDFFSLQCDLYKAELLERGLPTAFARENISMKEKQIAVFNSHRDDLLDYIARRISNINTRKGIYHLLVIDNLDQHIPYLQQVGFIDSVATATHMKVPVLFTLRDTSFEHEAAHQALSAYTFDYLNLSMPSIKEVVSKRIDTLRETWAKHVDSSENVRFLVDGKEHDVKKQDAYIKGLAVLDLLAGKEVSEWVNDILTKTSNQSVRELLRIVRLILSSYHTFAPLSSREEFDPSVHSTTISLPRIMLALILGNNPFYQDDSDTPVVNLFENRSDGHNNFFLRVRILQSLSSKGSGATLGDVLKTMEAVFQAGEGPCIYALERLLKKRLLNLRPSDLARTEGLDLQKHGSRRIFLERV